MFRLLRRQPRLVCPCLCFWLCFCFCLWLVTSLRSGISASDPDDVSCGFVALWLVSLRLVLVLALVLALVLVRACVDFPDRRELLWSAVVG